MQPNFPIIAAAALLPIVLGFVWYNTHVFGKAWMAASGVTEETIKNSNMFIILGLTYVFSFFLAMGVNFMVVHQFHLYSMVMNDPGFGDPNSPVQSMLKDIMSKYGNEFRSFKHGAFHGFLGGLQFALPIIGINALFERRGVKYIAIHTGYWLLTLILMGAIISHFRA